VRALRAALEGDDDPAVQRHAPRQRDGVVAAGAQQRVGEGEPTGAPGHRRHESGGLGPLQRLQQLWHRGLGSLGQYVDIELRAEHGAEVDDGAVVVAEQRHPLREQRAHGGAGGAVACGQLADEQRVAARVGDHGSRVHVCAQGLQQGADGVEGQALQIEPFDVRESSELGEEDGELVVQVGCGVARRDHDQHGSVAAGPRHVAHRAARGRRPPVDVLDDQEQRERLRSPREVAEQGVEHLLLGADRVEEIGQGRARQSGRQLGDGARQRLAVTTDAPSKLGVRHVREVLGHGGGEGPVWLAAALEAGADQDTATGGVDVSGELGHQAALADAGVAGDHGDQEVAGGRPPPEPEQRLPFLFATDEGAAVLEQLDGGRQPGGAVARRLLHVLGERRQLEPPAHRQLPQQRRNVRFHGALGQVEAGGDLGVGEALGQRRQDLGLPSGDATLSQQLVHRCHHRSRS
jgi:hypothetical protein